MLVIMQRSSSRVAVHSVWMRTLALWLLLLLAIGARSWLELVEGATGASCPAGYTRLDVCLGGECPNQAEAGKEYVCFQDIDTCCSRDKPTPVPLPPPSTCNDGALNCPTYAGLCRHRCYANCMYLHCKRKFLIVSISCRINFRHLWLLLTSK